VIVQEPPYDMVALFADHDAKEFFDALIERGQERQCLARIRWRSLRDPRRDPFVQHPVRSLGPFTKSQDVRFLIVWDYDGAGMSTGPEATEVAVLDEFQRSGVSRERVLAISMVPEVEILLAPVWQSAMTVLAAERNSAAPSPEDVLRYAHKLDELVPEDFILALERKPKELLRGALRALQLRPSAALYRKLGQELSIPSIKSADTAARIARTLQSWFPPA
jgi:hypothetical protein